MTCLTRMTAKWLYTGTVDTFARTIILQIKSGLKLTEKKCSTLLSLKFHSVAEGWKKPMDGKLVPCKWLTGLFPARDLLTEMLVCVSSLHDGGGGLQAEPALITRDAITHGCGPG